MKLLNTLNQTRLTHSLKTAIACAIGILLTRALKIQSSQWIIVTIVVVMCAQIYVGSVIQRAYFRFLGTLTGCLFATITLLTFGDTSFAILFAICISAFAFSYLATSNENLVYTGTLGAATTAIIMLGQKPTILFAAERFFEISIGILIATIVSQFILPIHARSYLRSSQAKTLKELRSYYLDNFIQAPPSSPANDIQHLDEAIVKSLSKQRQLVNEAKREPLGLLYDPQHFMQTLQCEKELLRAMAAMKNADNYLKAQQINLCEEATILAFHQAVIDTLATIAHAIQKPTEHTSITLPNTHAMQHELMLLVKNNKDQTVLHLYGFLFSTEMLREWLNKLMELYQLKVIQNT